MAQLADRIALVTGGAQGLGAALCLRLAREGCDVVVADLDTPSRRSERQEWWRGRTGRRTDAFKVNVADEEQVRALFDGVVGKFGEIKCLVANNAGVVRLRPD